MKDVLAIASFLLILALLSSPTNAQSSLGEAGIYAKDGLSFRYPIGWLVTEKSTAKKQYLIVSNERISAQVVIVAPRESFRDGRSQLDSARIISTQPLIVDLAKKFGVHGSSKSPPLTKSVCVEVSGRKASGVRLKGTHNKQPSTGDVLSFMQHARFINLLYVRADKDDTEGSVAWRYVRESFKIDKPASAVSEPDRDDFFSPGVLTGNAVLPRPEYPSFARGQVRGVVDVQVTVDEMGTVISADAVRGHKMLRQAAVDAARRAKFAPTILCGEAVKVSGIISYNF